MAHRIGPGSPDGGWEAETDEPPVDASIEPSFEPDVPEVQPSEPAVSGTMSRMDLGRQGSRNGYGMLQPPARHHRLRGVLVVLVMGALVLLVLASVGRPLLRTLAVDLAQANPQTLRVSFVADLVREQLGSQLTDPAGQDASPVQFVVPAGASAADIANQLAGQQLLTEPLAFEFVAITSGESGEHPGRHLLPQPGDDADPAAGRPPGPGARQPVHHDGPAQRSADRADHRVPGDLAAAEGRGQGLLRPGQQADRRPPSRLPVPRRPAGRPLARGLPWLGHLQPQARRNG